VLDLPPFATVLTTDASMFSLSEGPEAARELACAHRELITRRLPLLAIAWLGVGLVMRSGLILQSALTPAPAIVSLTLQAVVFAIAIAICRADPHAPRVLPVTLVACGLLNLLSAGFFGYTGGKEETLLFALFTLGLGSSLAFAWGWGVALGHLAVSVVAWVVAAPYLHHFVTRTERGLEIAIGSCVWLGVAEAAARSFRTSWHQERARHVAARKLAASRDAYRDLAENARDLIYTHDLEGHLTYVNEAFARYVGTPAAELLGRSCPDMMPREGNPDPRAAIARLAAGEAVPPLLFWVQAGNGQHRWLECVISGIRDPDGGVAGVRGIARDVTARKRAEDALRASEERLRRLSRHQASIREEERKRLGFDLHDDVCQDLVGIGILVESLRRQLAPESVAMDTALARVGRYVTEVGEHLRQLARELRPMLLRDLGLEESLHSLADGMTTAGMSVAATFPTSIPRLREETEIGVYRIAQEALTNAARHAGASSIRLTLATDGPTLRLEVTDDGCGFAPDDRRGSEALGLVGMEERALALGGRLEVHSAPGHGTTVRLVCPFELRASASAA
jgi:two-component system sensor histidine kinase UhpB